MSTTKTWIPVTEKTPTVDTVVWAYGYRITGQQFLGEAYLDQWGDWRTNDIDNARIHKITHWQKIVPPTPPTD